MAVSANTQLSAPRVGMTKDKHPSHLSGQEYPFALNGTMGSYQGDEAIMQNEPSNLRSYDTEGWKICGYKLDQDGERLYLFMNNPVTGISKIAQLDDNPYVEQVLGDEIIGTDGLENSENRFNPVGNLAETIIEDDGPDTYGGALGFDVRNPIYDSNIIIKAEKCGKRIYWAQKGKPARYVDLDKAKDPDSEYYFKRKPLCGDPDEGQGERVKLNTEKLRIFPLLSAPHIDIVSVQYGGSLRSGIYELLVAYCDQSGIETSAYYSLTNQVPIFDEANTVVEGNSYGQETSRGIKLNVKGLDEGASFYKMAVIQCADPQNKTICFIEGVHSITEHSVYLTASAGNVDGGNSRDYEITTFEHLALPKIVYKTADGMATAGKMIFHYGLTTEAAWNLQPIANLLGSLFKWETAIASEDLYKESEACAKYKGYMRDEVYPFGIRFFTNEGFVTHVFPLIGRPKDEETVYTEYFNLKEGDDATTNQNNKDVQSILANAPVCGDVDRRELWQFYNTATKTESAEVECENKIDYVRERVVEDWFCTLKGGDDTITIDVADTANFTDTKTYLSENRSSICTNGASGLLSTICSILNHKTEGVPEIEDAEIIEVNNEFPTGENIFGECTDSEDGSGEKECRGCKDIRMDTDKTNVWVTEIVGESTTYTYVRKLDDYANTEKSGAMLSGQQGDVSAGLFGDDFPFTSMGIEVLDGDAGDGDVIDPDDPDSGEGESSEVEPPFDWREEDPIDPNNPTPPAGSNVEDASNGRSCVPKDNCSAGDCDFSGEYMHYAIINHYVTFFEAVPASSNMGKGRGSAIVAEVYNGTSVLNWGAFQRRFAKLGKYYRLGKNFNTNEALCRETEDYLLGKLYEKEGLPCKQIIDDSDQLFWTDGELTIRPTEGFDFEEGEFNSDWSFNLLLKSTSDGTDQEIDGCSNVLSGISYFRWADRLHKDASWWAIEKPEKEEWWSKGRDPEDQFFVLEYIGCRNAGPTTYDKDKKLSAKGRDVTTSTKIRITFLKQSIDIEGNTIDNTFDIIQNPFDTNEDGVLVGRAKPVVINSQQTKKVKITPRWFEERWGNVNKVYVVFDTPLVLFGAVFNGYKCNSARILTYNYCTAMTESQFSLIVRKPDIDKLHMKFEEMKFSKGVSYSATCTLCVPAIPACETVPYERGKFAFWESTEKYPANSELYDSSRLSIDEETLRDSGMDDTEIAEFRKHYPGFFSDEVEVEEKANFCQKPIRHFKFPNNIVAPFIFHQQIAPFAHTLMFPIGGHIKKSTVKAFLAVAVKNKLITQKQADAIIGFEIVRGDRTFSRSIVAAGLGYDMFNYEDELSDPNDDSTKVWFSNFPYNDNSSNKFIYKDKKRNGYIKHPYDSLGRKNDHYTFHSPETHFLNPSLPAELVVDGYQRGDSVGVFQSVEDHPKWVVLAKKSHSWAKTFATIEVAAEIAAYVADITAQVGQATYTTVGTSTGTSPIGWVSVVAMSAATIANAAMSILNWGKHRYEWETIFLNNGTMRNFANYYTSYGSYTNIFTEIQAGNMMRGLTTCKYLKQGKFSAIEKGRDAKKFRINAINRESSVVLSTGSSDFAVTPPAEVARYDNSRVDDYTSNVDGSESDDRSSEKESSICSPYMKLKSYIPAQYGDIYSIKWVTTGGIHYLEREIMPEDDGVHVFGGDIYISRMTLKRKCPLFLNDNILDTPDMTPIAYGRLCNIGSIKYFVNFDTSDEAEDHSGMSFPTRRSQYELNAQEQTGSGFYIKGKFYTSFYGIPSFLVESEINLHWRQAGQELREGFYPYISDYAGWTQENKVPIREDNVYKYNFAYLKGKSNLGGLILPATYNGKTDGCMSQKPSGVIWSSPDTSESSIVDPWIVYKYFDNYDLPTSNGKLIDIRGIESQQLLVRFENMIALYNSIDVLRDRLGASSEAGGGIFSQRNMEFNMADLGYSGTQSRDMISCEMGHIWVDARRGHVFRVDPNGQNLQELSGGMRNWLKENLPYKILRYNITNVETAGPIGYADFDNKFCGMGVTLGWDSRFHRLFVTKRDYIPVREDLAMYKYYKGRFFHNGNEVSLTDTSYFKDVSFTIGLWAGQWISVYSFAPDFYIPRQHYFQTAFNFSNDRRKRGIWSHLLTNRSYQVFYGDLYPFIIESIARGSYDGSMLATVNYQVESRKFHTENDYAVNRLMGFNKAYIYNDTNNSGELRLIPRKINNLQQDVTYPRTVEMYCDAVTGKCREILVTEIGGGKWAMNDFWNQVRDDLNDVPIWKRDENNIHMQLNPDALIYDTPMGDRIRGEWHLVRLMNDAESKYQMMFKWMDADVRRDELV